MPAMEIVPNIDWIGVNDRTTPLFEGLWPIDREGVSYNAYLVRGEKTALIDAAKDFKLDDLLAQMRSLIDPAELDYIVVNHMEPDHTGVLRTLMRLAPRAELLCSKRAVKMLAAYYGITERIRPVADGEEIDLGGKRLRFIDAPMLHWPETMMTFETTQGVLFSCDVFGSYGAFQGALCDDRCRRLDFYEREALRYYVNIVSLFPKAVLKALGKLEAVPVRVIAPSHGLIWRKEPQRIVSLYRQWASYALEGPPPGVTLLYATMYGNTEKVVDAVAAGVVRAGLPVEVFDVHRHHVSYILPSLYTRRGVVIAAPTYEGGLFPLVAHVLDMAERKRMAGRKVAYLGSYGWGGGAAREVKRWAEALKWEMGETLAFHGGAKAEVMAEAEALGYRFARSLMEAGA